MAGFVIRKSLSIQRYRVTILTKGEEDERGGGKKKHTSFSLSLLLCIIHCVHQTHQLLTLPSFGASFRASGFCCVTLPASEFRFDCCRFRLSLADRDGDDCGETIFREREVPGDFLIIRLTLMNFFRLDPIAERLN